MLFLVQQSSSWKKLLGYTYLHMVIWNVATTWWVAKASVEGGLGAFFANSLIMCVPWLLYYFTQKKLKGVLGTASIIAYWLTFEYIHHNWDLSWPWLTLGNAFATHPNWVQWYEYTGTSGGSFWVLLSNVLVFQLIKTYQNNGRDSRYFKLAASWILVLFAPILFSFFIKNNLTLLHNTYNVVVVQPNIDPYKKIERVDAQQQLQSLIDLSQQEMDDHTALVVWPETAIPKTLDETHLKDDPFMEPVWNFLKQYPKINLLTGIEGYKTFTEKPGRFATPFRDGNGYYESYNSAAMLDSGSVQIYHKSRLVPGVEVLPGFLSFMAPVFEKFGGTANGYARDSTPRILPAPNKSYVVTPAICYESIYGDYLADFNRQGSDLICVITNDGWWGNTQGHKQHMNYARLRAIESRKWVARSANTGISCFIDPFGNVIQQLPWDKAGAIKQQIQAYVTETFFTRHGDVLSKLMSLFSAVLLLLGITIKFKQGKNKAG